MLHHILYSYIVKLYYQRKCNYWWFNLKSIVEKKSPKRTHPDIWNFAPYTPFSGGWYQITSLGVIYQICIALFAQNQ